MCGGNGMMQPGGPGMVERNSQVPFNPAMAGQAGGGAALPSYQPSAPQGGGFDFATFMQNPQVQAWIQQRMAQGPQQKMGGGMQGGGLLNQPGTGMRPMTPVMPPTQGPPPGVGIGFTPQGQPQPRPGQMGMTAPVLPPNSMGVRGLR